MNRAAEPAVKPPEKDTIGQTGVAYGEGPPAGIPTLSDMISRRANCLPTPANRPPHYRPVAPYGVERNLDSILPPQAARGAVPVKGGKRRQQRPPPQPKLPVRQIGRHPVIEQPKSNRPPRPAYDKPWLNGTVLAQPPAAPRLAPAAVPGLPTYVEPERRADGNPITGVGYDRPRMTIPSNGVGSFNKTAAQEQNLGRLPRGHALQGKSKKK